MPTTAGDHDPVEHKKITIKKYVAAPCSNCKGQIRDIIKYYDAWNKAGIYYGGLVELMVNAMVDVKEPFLKFGEEEF